MSRDEYRVMYGKGEGNYQPEDLYDIPYKSGRDDGLKKSLPFCWECSQHDDAPAHQCVRVQPICPDCDAGMLIWAEAGYVPWHRICNHCGSHWELHPGPDGYIQRARFYP